MTSGVSIHFLSLDKAQILMKILLVNKFHYHKGGAETYYFDLAEGLRSLGHSVIFFSSQNEKNESCAQEPYFTLERDYSGNSTPVAKLRDGLAAIYSFDAKKRFNRLLEDEKPDIVHLNLVQRQLTFSIMDAPALKGIPVVYTAHDYGLICPKYLMLDGSGAVCEACVGGHFSNCIRRCCIRNSYAKSTLVALESAVAKMRGCFERIDAVLTPSRFMAEKLIEGGVPADIITIAHNYVNNNLFQLALHPNKTLRKRKSYFLFFGRLSREKGIDVLIDAYASICDCLPQEMPLIIVGDGPERNALEAQSRKRGVVNRIRFVGFQTGHALQDYIENAYFCVLSSRCFENYPYSIVEAFAYGTPVIGSCMGGIPELVFDNETGFLCQSENAESFARAIIKAAFMKSYEYSEMQARCRKYVTEECSKDAYLKLLMDVYENAKCTQEHSK